MERFSPYNLPPQQDPEAQQLADSLVDVQQEIENSLLTVHDLDVINAEPAKPLEGMIRYADGVSWDPGFGEGPYIYRNGLWWPMWPWDYEYDVPIALAHGGAEVLLGIVLTAGWVELPVPFILGADAKNIRLGTTTGRLQLWYDAGFQAKATHLYGTIAFTSSAVLPINGDTVRITLMKNGVAVGSPLVSEVSVVQQTAGSPQTLALSTVVAGALVHGDELSLAVQGIGIADFNYTNLAVLFEKDMGSWYTDQVAAAAGFSGDSGGIG